MVRFIVALGPRREIPRSPPAPSPRKISCWAASPRLAATIAPDRYQSEKSETYQHQYNFIINCNDFENNGSNIKDQRSSKGVFFSTALIVK